MLKVVTSSSVDKNASAAGQEAGQQITAGLKLPKVAFVYASCDYDLEALLKGFKTAAPNVPFIGNTSFTGVILPQGIIEGESGFVGALALEDEWLAVGVAGLEKKGSAVETGRAVAKLALTKAGRSTPPTYFNMVAPPGEEEFYLKGITEVIGRVPFFGGSAADNSIKGDWKLYTDELITADGVAVAFFYSSKPIANLYTGAYRETSDVGIITKVKDNRVLVEIDGVPALKKYASWRGVAPESLFGGDLLVSTINSPLGVKDRLGDLVAIRHPMNGNPDYSMNIGNNLSEGTAVIRMEGTQDELINSASETLAALKKKADFEPAAYVLVHCGGRRAGMGDRLGEVYRNLKQVAGDVPFICQFTFGEYGYEQDDRNTCGGLMLSYTAFAK
ncbi:MAG: FIST C-terminal domain-containing protein [Deltaproteobacteria bacterium]|nr:FIST C-terminal domain-containing protein [Deltaproteobacteria bacterium]